MFKLWIIKFNFKKFKCDKCIVTTGGASLKKTGSSGDGFILAKNTGHNIIDVKPGLVPLRSKDSICKKLQGLSLRNISFSLLDYRTSSFKL